MILVDTSVWVDHLRSGDEALSDLLGEGAVLTHPLIIGELAMGMLRQRAMVLGSLQRLPQATSANDEEALAFIEQESLYGRGIGYVDAHLLAATRLSAGATLWTRDKKLLKTARELGLSAALE